MRACVTAISFLSLHYLVLCYSHFEYLICCICIGMMSLRCLCYVFANGNYSVRLCNVWCIEVKKNYEDPTREPKTGTNLPVNTILVGKRCLHTSFEFFFSNSAGELRVISLRQKRYTGRRDPTHTPHNSPVQETQHTPHNSRTHSLVLGLQDHLTKNIKNDQKPASL
jgi:hypothetical protein